MNESVSQDRQIINLGLALVISAWIHILGLALWHYQTPMPDLAVQPPLLVEVEVESETLLSPLKRELDSPSEANAQVKDRTGVSADAPTLEDTISLESKAPQYLSYLHQIKTRIRDHWTFPAEAREKRQGGMLTAVFTLNNSGQLVNVNIVSPSGHASLDQAAIEAIRLAAPYPTFPDHIKLKFLNIRAEFDYRFQYMQVQ